MYGRRLVLARPKRRVSVSAHRPNSVLPTTPRQATFADVAGFCQPAATRCIGMVEETPSPLPPP